MTKVARYVHISCHSINLNTDYSKTFSESDIIISHICYDLLDMFFNKLYATCSNCVLLTDLFFYLYEEDYLQGFHRKIQKEDGLVQ